MHFRLTDFRLYKWCVDRLTQLDDIELPRFQVNLATRSVLVTLAGCTRPRRAGDSQLVLLRQIVDGAEQIGETLTLKLRLVDEIPELGPFLAPKSRTLRMQRLGLYTRYALSPRLSGRVVFHQQD